MAGPTNDQYESLRRLASLWRGGSEKEAAYSDAIFNALEAVDEREALRAALRTAREEAYAALNQFDPDDDALPDDRAMYVQMKLCAITDAALIALKPVA